MRRLASLSGLFLLLITVAVLLYGCIAGRDIPPPVVTDLEVVRPDIHPEENAYTFFTDMTNTLYWPADSKPAEDYLAGEEADPAEIAAIIASNQAAFATIEKGLACSVCLPPEVTGFDTLMPYISEWLRAGKLLAIASRHARETHEYSRAADYCMTSLRFANLVRRDAESLLHYLVGTAILQIGLNQVRDLAMADDVPDPVLAGINNTLTQLDPAHPGLARAIKTEYRIVAKTMDDFARGEFGLENLVSGDEGRENPILRFVGRRNYFFQPEKTKQEFADLYRQIISNAPLAYGEMSIIDMDAMFDHKGSPHRYLLKPNAVGKIMEALLMPAIGGIMQRKCHSECSVAATKLIVAMRRYELAHGALPAAQEDVVPKFIDAWPSDPYDGRPIRYERKKAIIYAVGTDLTDNNGSTALPEEYTYIPDSQKQWKAEDVVFPLRAAVSSKSES